jgi:hypothetical protein
MNGESLDTVVVAARTVEGVVVAGGEVVVARAVVVVVAENQTDTRPSGSTKETAMRSDLRQLHRRRVKEMPRA